MPEGEASEQLLPETGSLAEEADTIEYAHPSSDGDVCESIHSGREADVSESADPASGAGMSEFVHSGREADTSNCAHLEIESDEVESIGSVEVTDHVVRNQHASWL
ncbi:hypothetical protein V6N11_036867 [Hibiscus sabdariffa]|uniref:Uncharacterized protein n=1 Tax=Hibiscus sabdariffa TaxID=183260 RepID=A0ABR2RC53_9ROSI